LKDVEGEKRILGFLLADGAEKEAGIREKECIDVHRSDLLSSARQADPKGMQV
jgi:hypothetical protein